MYYYAGPGRWRCLPNITANHRIRESLPPDGIRGDMFGALAATLGAQATFAPDDPRLEAESCQVAFECSSRNSAFQLLQTMLEPTGQLCVLADGNLEPLLLTPAFHAKELTVVGSSDGLDYRQYAG